MSLSDYLEKQRRAQAGVLAPTHGALVETDRPAMPATASQSVDKPTEPGILIRLWNRKIWALPWSYYIEAEYFPASINGGAGEQSNEAATNADAGNFTEKIQVVFASREIMMRGRNLAGLMESIVRHRVLELREVPEKFLETTIHDTTEPVIVDIEIRARAK